jgi:ABC-2 type transport system ATP-binding protein
METLESKSFALSVQNVFMKYGKKEILKDVSFKVFEGEVLGLLGPNGAGKTTLLSIIASIFKPSKGEILLKGGFKLGYVPQEIALYQSLSAFDNMAFWSDVYGIKNKKEIIMSLLELLNLSNVAFEKVYKFSTGMKRRLNIGIALIHNPEIIIMDEPTVGIDLDSKLLVIDYIKKLKSQGKSFIYTTHNPDEPERLCDRIGLLIDGALAGIGTFDDLKRKFHKNSIEDFMSKGILHE